MKTAPLSRRDRLRHILADLRMPGALEALDAVLQGVDGGTLTGPEAIEQLLMAQIQLRNNRRLQAAMRSSRLPAVKQPRDFDFPPRSAGSRSRASTSWASKSAGRMSSSSARRGSARHTWPSARRLPRPKAAGASTTGRSPT